MNEQKEPNTVINEVAVWDLPKVQLEKLLKDYHIMHLALTYLAEHVDDVYRNMEIDETSPLYHLSAQQILIMADEVWQGIEQLTRETPETKE